MIRNDLEAAERLLESGQAMYFARTAAGASASRTRPSLSYSETPTCSRLHSAPSVSVRGDKRLLAESIGGFERMGLDWHADETRALL